MPTVLVVEDNSELATLLCDNLAIEGHSTLVAPDGRDGLALARAHDPDLIILDLMLPVVDGTQVLSVLRREGFTNPVIVLSARADEVDRLLGFRLGADDYVTKPFSVLELMARVGARIRRDRVAPSDAATRERDVVRFADVEVDVGARSAQRGGTGVALAPRAFDLLVALIEARGNVVSRTDLLERVWGYARDVTTRTVDAHVAELRRKLEHDPANPAHILTARKAGYRLRV
ncbi:MAG TPA: response regulator transcription factor [Candidatus Elarobacter sp.]|nr:response regulator transcription factor [Candidatus Elarobacter sp.]